MTWASLLREYDLYCLILILKAGGSTKCKCGQFSGHYCWQTVADICLSVIRQPKYQFQSH